MTFSRSEFQAPPEIQCHGKVVYFTRKAAKQAIRRHGDRKGMNAYACCYCSTDAQTRWHVGHRPWSPPPTPQLKAEPQ